MAARILNTLCALALLGVASILLLAIGEQRGSVQCLAMVTAPNDSEHQQ